jgi:hypothetical protein
VSVRFTSRTRDFDDACGDSMMNVLRDEPHWAGSVASVKTRRFVARRVSIQERRL